MPAGKPSAAAASGSSVPATSADSSTSGKRRSGSPAAARIGAAQRRPAMSNTPLLAASLTSVATRPVRRSRT